MGPRTLWHNSRQEQPLSMAGADASSSTEQHPAQLPSNTHKPPKAKAKATRKQPSVHAPPISSPASSPPPPPHPPSFTIPAADSPPPAAAHVQPVSTPTQPMHSTRRRKRTTGSNHASSTVASTAATTTTTTTPRLTNSSTRERSLVSAWPKLSSCPEPKPHNVHTNERAWQERYRQAHAHERELVAQARQQQPPNKSSTRSSQDSNTAATTGIAATGFPAVPTSSSRHSSSRSSVPNTSAPGSSVPPPAPDPIAIPKAPPSIWSTLQPSGGYSTFHSSAGMQSSSSISGVSDAELRSNLVTSPPSGWTNMCAPVIDPSGSATPSLRKLSLAPPQEVNSALPSSRPDSSSLEQEQLQESADAQKEPQEASYFFPPPAGRELNQRHEPDHSTSLGSDSSQFACSLSSSSGADNDKDKPKHRIHLPRDLPHFGKRKSVAPSTPVTPTSGSLGGVPSGVPLPSTGSNNRSTGPKHFPSLPTLLTPGSTLHFLPPRAPHLTAPNSPVQSRPPPLTGSPHSIRSLARQSKEGLAGKEDNCLAFPPSSPQSSPQSGRSTQSLRLPLHLHIPDRVSSSSAQLLQDQGSYTSEEGEVALSDSESDSSSPEASLPIKQSMHLAHVDRHAGHGGDRALGDILLLGPAAGITTSRRPPEYDTGGMSGKESKITWLPWKHGTKKEDPTTPGSATATTTEDEGISSLVVYARFAVFAVSGNTVLTAHNHKVKIFRAGTVKAEVGESTESNVPGSASAFATGGTTFSKTGASPGGPSPSSTVSTASLGQVTSGALPGAATSSASLSRVPSSTIHEKKVVSIQDSDLSTGGRVTALCFLRPGEPVGDEPARARYAWVGTTTGVLWEVDVVQQVRTSLNRSVHKAPIVKIARLGDRVLVVDEGGKMSIWTPLTSAARSEAGGLSSSALDSGSMLNGHQGNNDAVSSVGDEDDRASLSSIRLTRTRSPSVLEKSFEPRTSGRARSPSDLEKPTEQRSTPNFSTASSPTSSHIPVPQVSNRLLSTRPATQRFPVEGKNCVPLLVGDQVWVATGGAQLRSYHASEPGSTAQGSGHKHKHSLPRTLRRSMRAAAGAAAAASHPNPQDPSVSLQDIKLYIFNPFADERPTTAPAPTTPLTLPSVVSGSMIGPVTGSAVVPCSPATVFLSHTTGHITEWSRLKYRCVGVHQNGLDPILCMTAAGRYLWAGTKGGKLLVFGLGDHRGQGPEVERAPGCRLVVIKSWVAHGGNPVTRLVTDPDGISLGRLQVVSGGMDGAVRVWDGLLAHDWFERRWARLHSHMSSGRSIRTLHVTYNIDAADPAMLRNPKTSEANRTFLTDLLRSAGRAPSVTMLGEHANGQQVKPVGPEVIVFGLQELINLEDKRLTAKSLLLSKKRIGNELGERISNQYASWRTALTDAVNETFGKGKYHLVESELLVGLMTCVFVASHEMRNLTDSAVSTVKTGMFGGRYGNKGAVVARLVLDDTSLAFVNCHLAAGQDHVQARNNDAATILSSSKLFPRSATLPPGSSSSEGPSPSALRRTLAFSRGGDGEQILDHDVIFWSGDLNYRISLARNDALSYLNSGNIAPLLDVDQLVVQSCTNAHFALRGFYELPIQFSPTYKFNHLSSSYDTSAKQRVPAWCDRILTCDSGQTYPATCVRWHDSQDDQAVIEALGPIANLHRDIQAPSSQEVTKTPPPASRPQHVTGHSYRSWAPTISDHRPVSSQFDVQLKRIDPKRLGQMVPRLKQEWAVVQAARLDEARTFYQTSIVG